MGRGPHKKPLALKLSAPVRKSNLIRGEFNPENPRHYVVAYMDRLTRAAFAVSGREAEYRRVGLGHVARRFSLSDAEVQVICDIVDVCLHDHAHGRRLAPYTPPSAAGPPGD